MVHAVHRSIQVYQDFHRQTLSHLQQLEQDSYQLMPQFELEKVFGMVERAHQIKAGAHYLNLNGFGQLAHQMKGRYLALTNCSIVFEPDLLKPMIQMLELFRLCLLSNVSTWQADLTTVVTKLPDIFRGADRYLEPHPQFVQDFPAQTSLESDIQRLLVSIVLIPELARLDMMLKNTPPSKLSEILIAQLPRLKALAQQLHLDELQHSMQISLLEIQARPSQSKSLGTQSLLKWSDLCYQTLTETGAPLPLRQTDVPSASFQDACVTDLEANLVALSVELIDGNEDRLVQAIQRYAQGILSVAKTFEVEALQQTTEFVLAALRSHPESATLIGRLAIQDWLRYQLDAVRDPSELGETDPEHPEVRANIHISETLLELAKLPINWETPADRPGDSHDPILLNLLNQVALPNAFHEYSSLEAEALSQAIAVTSQDLDHLSNAISVCQHEIEQLDLVPISLEQAFQGVLDHYHHLATVPLALVFNRFHPMADALGLQGYKELTLKFSGGQIAIDRQKAEILYELLMPLISNAVVHGIERFDERQRLGKGSKGQVFLSAYRQGDDGILIELQDDGRGLNFELLREWVMRQYGLSAQAGNFLTESEILDYLFHRKQIDSSGTHVEDMGLGSVQRSLEKLGGAIGVSTVMTQGTTVRITIPKIILPEPKLNPNEFTGSPSLERVSPPQRSPVYPTLSPDYSLDALRHQGSSGPNLALDTQGLFVWADQMYVYVLECDRIEEYVMPRITEAHQRFNILSWRDQSIPIFSLPDFLGDSAAEISQNDDVILVLKGEQQFLALRAPMQHLVNKTALSINHLSQALAAPRYIYGTTVIDDQVPRLVIDVAALIAQQPLQTLWPLPDHDQSESDSEVPVPTVSVQGERGNRLRIMVVDDSRTAREIVSMTLRNGGYEVLHAKDGVDALEQLQAQQAKQHLVDLIISDVAMPRMNGLEFLRQCRQDQALQSLPIAMLSNCDSTTHSELALKEGADAYLTKPYEESVFLGEIATLLGKVPEAVSGA